MNKLTRRSFGKIVVGASVPLLGNPLREFQKETNPLTVAGYQLTADENTLAQKFLENHEKNMRPLRGRDLPNSLAPDIIFASPVIEEEKIR